MEEKPSGVQVIRLWRIESNVLQEIPKSKLDLEDKLEEWIAHDVSIVSPNLLVIGRQVPTDFGGYVDLLCMEENGDIVIIELKRDKTPRDITAQLLDYASWVKDLSATQVQDIANKYLKNMSFEEAYQRKFEHELPESINEQHKMRIIGSEIDSSSRRIVNYLSESEVDINAITFNYFKGKDCEFIARTFLIEPTIQVIKQGTRLRNLTEEQLQSIADEKGVGEVFNRLAKELRPLFNWTGTTRSSLAFCGLQDGKMNTIFSLIPQESSREEGLKFRVYANRFSKYFNLPENVTTSILPENKKEWKFYKGAPPEYSGYEGFFKVSKEVEALLTSLQKAKLAH